MAGVERPRWYSRLRSRLAVKAFTDRSPKLIGSVAIVLIAVAVVAVIGLNSSMFRSSYPLQARFANAIGVGPGAKVVLAGVPVGSVGSVSLDGNSVVLDLDINQGVVLPRDTAASIGVETVLGVTDVQLRTGTDWSHPLRPGSTITNTTAPVEFFDVQSTAGKLLTGTDARALASFVQDLAQVTTGKSAQVSAIIDGLNRFTGTINARQQQVGQLIDAAEQLSGMLAGRDSQLASVVDDLNTVVAGLAWHASALGQLIDNTELAAAQTADLIGRNHPRIQQLLDALTADLKVIGAHQVDLAQSVAYAGSAITGFSSVAVSGSTPTAWANIYANVLGISGAYSVFGNCGLLDKSLDIALGPDPLPCSQRTGPLPTGGGSASSPAPTAPTSPSSGVAAGTAGAAGSGGTIGGGLPLPSLGLSSGSGTTSPLGALLSPLADSVSSARGGTP
jgi:phospholipid/cholesterol/gamma-HCH transport system substrate-binding protein